MTNSPDDASEDVLVLPWWRNPLNVILVALAVVALSFGGGYSVGHKNGGIRHNRVDTGFLQDMRIHHEQAVQMASLYLAANRTPDATVRTIASEIQFDQAMETGRMVQLLRMFGESETNESDQAMAWMHDPVPMNQMPGLASDAQMSELSRASGASSDKLFATLMIAHHEGGMHMLEYVITHGSNGEVREMAKSMAAAQAGEINELKKILALL